MGKVKEVPDQDSKGLFFPSAPGVRERVSKAATPRLNRKGGRGAEETTKDPANSIGSSPMKRDLEV